MNIAQGRQFLDLQNLKLTKLSERLISIASKSSRAKKLLKLIFCTNVQTLLIISPKNANFGQKCASVVWYKTIMQSELM